MACQNWVRGGRSRRCAQGVFASPTRSSTRLWSCSLQDGCQPAMATCQFKVSHIDWMAAVSLRSYRISVRTWPASKLGRSKKAKSKPGGGGRGGGRGRAHWRTDLLRALPALRLRSGRRPHRPGAHVVASGADGARRGWRRQTGCGGLVQRERLGRSGGDAPAATAGSSDGGQKGPLGSAGSGPPC
jgi:hypothetical protein